MIWILMVLQVISVACVTHLWARGRGSLVRKALWSPLVLLPVLGPLLYGSVYEPPSIAGEGMGQSPAGYNSVQ